MTKLTSKPWDLELDLSCEIVSGVKIAPALTTKVFLTKDLQWRASWAKKHRRYHETGSDKEPPLQLSGFILQIKPIWHRKTHKKLEDKTTAEK